MNFECLKSCFRYTLDLPKNCYTLRIIEFDLVPFNVMGIVMSMSCHGKVVSVNDYHDSQGSNYDLASDKQIKCHYHFDFIFLLVQK